MTPEEWEKLAEISQTNVAWMTQYQIVWLVETSKRLEAENRALRAALQGLVDVQNGPPLLGRHEDEWVMAMTDARALLTENSEGDSK